MKITLKLIAIAFIAPVFFLSCQKEFSVSGIIDNPFTYDSDAIAFFDSCGITDTTEKIAVNNFVVQLKDSSLWSKFRAIYPMLGGTAATTKWNLKDPRDLDAAFRLTFNGSPVFAKTGILFPTNSDYADTHLTDDQLGVYYNSSISYYSKTQNTTEGVDIGCNDKGVPFSELSIYGDYLGWYGLNAPSFPARTTGLFSVSSSLMDVNRYDNGLVTLSKGGPPVNNYTHLTFLIGKSYGGPSGLRECSFACLGESRTAAQELTFYTIVQNFETKLGR